MIQILLIQRQKERERECSKTACPFYRLKSNVEIFQCLKLLLSLVRKGERDCHNRVCPLKTLTQIFRPLRVMKVCDATAWLAWLGCVAETRTLNIVLDIASMSSFPTYPSYFNLLVLKFSYCCLLTECHTTEASYMVARLKMGLCHCWTGSSFVLHSCEVHLILRPVHTDVLERLEERHISTGCAHCFCL